MSLLTDSEDRHLVVRPAGLPGLFFPVFIITGSTTFSLTSVWRTSIFAKRKTKWEVRQSHWCSGFGSIFAFFCLWAGGALCVGGGGGFTNADRFFEGGKTKELM